MGIFEKLFSHEKSSFYTICLLASSLFLYNLMNDAIESSFKDFDYYFSESFLFNMIWLLFIPFAYLLHKHRWYNYSLGISLFTLFSLSISHLLLNALLIWVFSYAFFNHTFVFFRNFKFGFVEYFLMVSTIYVMFILLSRYLTLYKFPKNNTIVYLKNIVVLSKGVQHNIPIDDVIYITSQTPYVKIVTAKSKFLYQVSLKSLQNSLNPQQFVRIHRTTIVNTQSINTLKSRLNGDYDITMSNSEVLRMSRNYYANFRTIFNRMPKSITSS